MQLEIGNYSEAINYLKRSLAIYRDFGHYFNEGLATLIIIEAYIETGQFDDANRLIDQAENVVETEEVKDQTTSKEASMTEDVEEVVASILLVSDLSRQKE